MGYLRGVIHGTVIGTVAGLCIAPQTGKRTREQLSSFGDVAKDSYHVAEQAVRKVTPLAKKMRHSVPTDDEAHSIAVEGTVRVHDEHNGHSHR